MGSYFASARWKCWSAHIIMSLIVFWHGGEYAEYDLSMAWDLCFLRGLPWQGKEEKKKVLFVFVYVTRVVES